MASFYDLTTLNGLEEYLVDQSRDPEDVQWLSGGTANYLYRVKDGEGHSDVYKHAAPYLSSNTNFPFSQARMDYEAYVLKLMRRLEDNWRTPNTQTVRFLEYDEKHKLLCIEDGGERNLKVAFDDPQLDICEIASNLAKWLATLHLQSTNFSLALSPQTKTSVKGNNPFAVQIYRYSYNNLHHALSKYVYEPHLAERANKEFGSLLEVDDECVCHGDFWPGNVLVRPQASRDLTQGGLKPVDLTIVDWEMARRGTSATDVGQFAAEAFLLDRFRGERGLRNNFLSCYLVYRESSSPLQQIGREWVRRMAAHWAVHIAFWPTRVPWTDEDGTKKLVNIGVGVLKAALDSDWEALKVSPLFKDLKNEWYGAFMYP